MTLKIAGIAAAVAASLLTSAVYAQTRLVDPDTLAPHARARALHSSLGDRDPWGYPAASGCTWSRIQVPTAQGLRWQAMEDCNPDMWR